MYACVHVCVCTCSYICMCVCTCVYACMCAYIMYVGMLICVCTATCMYMCVHLQNVCINDVRVTCRSAGWVK